MGLRARPLANGSAARAVETAYALSAARASGDEREEGGSVYLASSAGGRTGRLRLLSLYVRFLELILRAESRRATPVCRCLPTFLLTARNTAKCAFKHVWLGVYALFSAYSLAIAVCMDLAVI